MTSNHFGPCVDIVACDQDEVQCFCIPPAQPDVHRGAANPLRTLVGYEMRSKSDIAPHRLLVAAPLYHMNALAIAAALLGRDNRPLPQFTTEGYVWAGTVPMHVVDARPTMMALITKTTLWQGRTCRPQGCAYGIRTRDAAPFDDIRKAFPGALISTATATAGHLLRSASRRPANARPSIGYPVPEVRMRLVDGDNLDADRRAPNGLCKTRATTNSEKQPRS